MSLSRYTAVILSVLLFAGGGMPAAYAQKNFYRIVRKVTSTPRQYVVPSPGKQAVSRYGIPRTENFAIPLPKYRTPIKPPVPPRRYPMGKNQTAFSYESTELASSLLQQVGHPLKALRIMWRNQSNRYYRSLFPFLAAAYSKQYFPNFSPHMREFFHKAGTFQDKNLETQIVHRLMFLGTNKEHFHQLLSPNTHESGMRLYYLNDIVHLTPQNFSPSSLVLSFERKLSPQQPSTAIRHVNLKTKFHPIGGFTYPVYQYAGPWGWLPDLYNFLVNGPGPQKKLLILFDKNSRSMAIYNEDRSVWLRITPHEYENANNIHLHLHEKRPVRLTTLSGRPVTETVMLNLSIPLGLGKRQDMPASGQEGFLYNQLVLNPLEYFRGKDYVTIQERLIF